MSEAAIPQPQHEPAPQPQPAQPRVEPGAAPAPAVSPFRHMKKELTMLGVLIALAVATAVLNPVFLGGDNLRNTIRHISLISLFALGEAVVIIAGGIDLSIGSVICIAGVTTSYLTMYGGLGIVTSLVIAILLALAVGVLQGLVIARLGVQPFV